MASKKVLLAVGALSGGGAERVASLWASMLQEQGFDVSMLIISHVADEYAVAEGVKIYPVAASVEAFLQIPYWKRILRMRAILKQVRPDVLIPFLPTSQIYMMLASAGLGIRRIETIRISPWEVRLNPLRYALWRWCYRSAWRIILQTAEQASFFSTNEQRKSVVIPNPLSPQIVANDKETQAERVTRFIAAGRIDPQKNYPMMIDGFAAVAAEYPELQLRIFGTGPSEYVEQIQQHIERRKMQGHIQLMGRTPQIEEEYKESDVFLMTSDFEGSPNALIEAMASRLVCISTACKTGPRDLITSGENGFLIPVGGVDALAATMRQVLAMDSASRSTMAEAARARVLEMCSEEQSLRRLCDTLQS